jgi:hypothetical protein
MNVENTRLALPPHRGPPASRLIELLERASLVIRSLDSFEAVLPSELTLCNQWQQVDLLADYLGNGVRMQIVIISHQLPAGHKPTWLGVRVASLARLNPVAEILMAS